MNLFICSKQKNSLFASQIVKIMKLTFIFLVAALLQVSAKTKAQNISITAKNIRLEKLFKEITRQSGYAVFYNSNLIKNAAPVSIDIKNATVKELLDKCLKGEPLDYFIENKTIVITKKPQGTDGSKPLTIAKPVDKTVNGKVTDEKGQPIPGASVVIKNTTRGVSTSADGSFTITVPDNSILVFSFVGYEKKEIAVGAQTFINVQLTPSGNLAEVVVSGIRASQQKALDIKRNSDQVVDAISAVDVGKLPDKNIAEALQRVSGVAIQRTRGQGDFISIRGLGPQFVSGYINGRTIVSSSTSTNSVQSGGTSFTTGRETNFDVLPSEMIDRIEVFKTPSASDVEGGIGGVVNIVTAKPLTLGNKFLLSAREEDYTFAKKLSPDLNVLGSWVNKKKTFGALLGVIYSERSIREDNDNSFGYATFFGPAFGSTNSIDNTGSGHSNATNVTFPFTSNMEAFKETRKRLTVNNALQWKLSDKTNASFDFTYSRLDLQNSEVQTILLAQPVDFPFTPVTNPDGSVQYPGMQISSSNTGANYDVIGQGNTTTYNEQRNIDNTFNTGFHLTHKTDNGWKMDYDAALSSSVGKYTGGNIVFVAPDEPFNISVLKDKYVVATPASYNQYTPESLVTRQVFKGSNTNKDREYSAKADAEKKINSGFISSIKFGLRYADRDKQYLNNQSQYLSATLNVAQQGVPYAYGPSDFLGGNFPVNMSQMAFPTNINSTLAAYGKAGFVLPAASEDHNNEFAVKESTLGGYVQANLKGTLGDIPFTGNAGVRLVNTHTDVTSHTQAFDIVFIGGVGSPVLKPGIIPVEAKSNYTTVLPSINLKFEVSDNTNFRVGYSKTISRPLFSDMGGLSINYTNLFVNRYGNAALKPYGANNYDADFEWYVPGGGLISTSFYYKTLNNFISNSTTHNIEFLGIDYKTFNQPENQGKGNVYGNELSYQQPLKFLPGFLSGLGVIANFTFANGQLNLNNGSPVSFPGISSFSYNTALYYDNGGKFQARLAYTYRGQYLIIPSDVFGQQLWQHAYGQVDGSVSYKINKTITIFGDATNLLNSISKTFTTNNVSPAFDYSRPVSYAYDGVRVAMGIKVALK